MAAVCHALGGKAVVVGSNLGKDATEELGPIRLARMGNESWAGSIKCRLFGGAMSPVHQAAPRIGCLQGHCFCRLRHTIGPDFTAPIAPLAEKFRDVDNRSVKSGPLEYQHWWEGFHDPTLNRLIEIAYNQNLYRRAQGPAYYRHVQCWELRLGCRTRRCSKEWARSSIIGPAPQHRWRSERNAFVFLDRRPCGASGLGTGFLGQVSPRC